ncbi:hypothetical protein AB1Y20_020659 [Prymnesium parvum]|uniref:Uncharacterized protein n=1 Tax=Prymnesium parvum TaxID=97485 RepID=A0AB34JY26_PRYPA
MLLLSPSPLLSPPSAALHVPLRASPRRLRLSASPPLDDEHAFYSPFIESTMALLREHHVELQPYALDDSLRRRDSRAVRLAAEAYASPKLRQLRLVHLYGSPKLQVLNLCLFPRLEYGLPSFAADLVSLPGGHLVALDWSPNGEDYTRGERGGGAAAALRRAFATHRAALPGGGEVPAAAARYFSECFLFTRLPRVSPPSADAEAVRAAILPAFEDYLRLYLQVLEDASPLSNEAELAEVRKAHLEYQNYRAEKDPARGMLTSLFGVEFTERLIHEVLFDLPVWLASPARQAR